ncbi:MAG: hypothetical protein M3442_16285 [Chloroflexota bacterium]|nr:hypothetical protein [Chloroflexota bacterium]
MFSQVDGAPARAIRQDELLSRLANPAQHLATAGALDSSDGGSKICRYRTIEGATKHAQHIRPAAPHQRQLGALSNSDTGMTKMPPPPHLASIEVFYSYAHADEALRDQLVTHLALLRRQKLIHEWHDRVIRAGTDWAL